jgi:hypothetical protein
MGPQCKARLEADRIRFGSGASVPGPAPCAEALLEPIFQPDLSAADNAAACENLFQFFRILFEWDLAERRPRTTLPIKAGSNHSELIQPSILSDGSTPP